MITVPLTLKEVNEYIIKYHRHHGICRGHRFSIGAVSVDSRFNRRLVGIAVVGRPVCRNVSQYEVAEVTRLATDGTKNACSYLYAACARIAREMGFVKIQTYILESEPGTSLEASGWKFETMTKGGNWASSKKYREQGRRQDQPQCPKKRYAKVLNE